MSLTLSNRSQTTFGHKHCVLADVAFDASYPAGGEALTPSNFSLNTIERLVLESRQGYSFEYDYTNSKIKTFVLAPPIVHEEVVTVTSNVGYLKWPAAHIEYVTDDSNDYRVIPGGLTPTAKFVAVDMGFSLTTGVLTKGQRCSLTFLAADSVTSCKVSYVTQAWKEVTDNMVQACLTSGARTYGHANLSFTAGTPDIVKLGEDFIALQSVCWNNGGTLTPMSALKDDATEAAAKKECVVDFRKTTTFGEIGFNETDAVDTASDVVYFNYIKDPGAGHFLYDRFVNTEIADNTDTLPFTSLPLIYCTCGGIPMETTDKKCLMTGVEDTIAAGEGHWTSHPFLIGTTLASAPIITMEASTDDDSYPALIVGHPSEVETVPLECPNAVDLSNLTGLKIMAIGY